MSALRKLSVVLTPEQADEIQSAVDAGEYASPDDALQEALRDWHAKREETLRLRALWDEGMAGGPADSLSFQTLKEEARARLAAAKGTLGG